MRLLSIGTLRTQGLGTKRTMIAISGCFLHKRAFEKEENNQEGNPRASLLAAEEMGSVLQRRQRYDR